jgi:DNA-binding SARP family transcriptional activator
VDADPTGEHVARWRLFVLGPPRLEREGAAVRLGLRKAVALLVYLAVTGRAHSRDALATLLWPEHAPADGRARLRRTVHDLTSLAGRDLLVAGVDALGPAPAALWLDSADFERRAGAAGPADPAELERAAALYVDDFLAGFSQPDSPAFDDWQRFQRERLRLVLATALSHLAAGGAAGAPP